jgi:hypothetical protein
MDKPRRFENANDVAHMPTTENDFSPRFMDLAALPMPENPARAPHAPGEIIPERWASGISTLASEGIISRYRSAGIQC